MFSHFSRGHGRKNETKGGERGKSGQVLKFLSGGNAGERKKKKEKRANRDVFFW